MILVHVAVVKSIKTVMVSKHETLLLWWSVSCFKYSEEVRKWNW